MPETTLIHPVPEMILRKLTTDYPDEPGLQGLFRRDWNSAPIGTEFRVEMLDDKPEYGGEVVYLNFPDWPDDPRVVLLPPAWFTTEHFCVV